mmetsp:Transcript_8910/g.16828  ORF Transcript_8910/g.16828 Transcript_8910/m.16828 type:complete len:212 (-) Transcript_8910:735-1370(-)
MKAVERAISTIRILCSATLLFALSKGRTSDGLFEIPLSTPRTCTPITCRSPSTLPVFRDPRNMRSEIGTTHSWFRPARVPEPPIPSVGVTLLKLVSEWPISEPPPTYLTTVPTSASRDSPCIIATCSVTKTRGACGLCTWPAPQKPVWSRPAPPITPWTILSPATDAPSVKPLTPRGLGILFAVPSATSPMMERKVLWVQREKRRVTPRRR